MWEAVYNAFIRICKAFTKRTNNLTIPDIILDRFAVQIVWHMLKRSKISSSFSGHNRLNNTLLKIQHTANGKPQETTCIFD